MIKNKLQPKLIKNDVPAQQNVSENTVFASN